MAGNKPAKNAKVTKKVRYDYIHRLSASVALLAFTVILTGGLLSHARLITIIYRTVGVTVLISVVTRIVTQILATYEEMDHSGKAETTRR